MIIREDSENPAGTAASLPLELATCRRQLEECQRHSAQLAEENDRLRDIGEEALRETRAALEFTLKSGRIGDWDLDLVTDTSRRSLRHDECFGYRDPIPEADWGISVFIQHLHPDDRARVEASLRSAIAATQDWASEFRAIWPDGSVHWLDARGSIYRTSEGRPKRMLGTVMDITDRKQGEEGLRASEQVS